MGGGCASRGGRGARNASSMISARHRARARRPAEKPDIPLGGPPLISGSLPQPARLREFKSISSRAPTLPVKTEHLFYHRDVVSAEPRLTDVEYEEVQCKSALNPVKGMGFNWSLNPYTGCEHRCAFCYVRAFELRADRPSDDRYGRTVRVKVNVAGVLRGELSRRSWRRETVVVGAATDLARRADLHISVSIPTVDDDIWRRTEPGTAHPRQRLRAIEKLVAAGIDVGVGMAPILPGLSDRPEGIEAVVKAARAAGATGLWAGMLHLKDGTREHFMSVLGMHWPELVPRYEAAYRARAYLPQALGESTMKTVARLRTAHGVSDRRRIVLKPPPEPEQLALLG